MSGGRESPAAGPSPLPQAGFQAPGSADHNHGGRRDSRGGGGIAGGDGELSGQRVPQNSRLELRKYYPFLKVHFYSH